MNTTVHISLQYFFDTKYCFLFNKLPVLTGKNLIIYLFLYLTSTSASTSISGTLTRHPDPQSSENARIPLEPPVPPGHHATEPGNQNGQNPGPSNTTENQNGQNPGPSNTTGTQNPAQAPQKELTEEQKKIKEKQKRELEDLLETIDKTEKMVFMAFPFQEAIVLGNFYATFPNTMKTIRIFTSSTFTGRSRYLYRDRCNYMVLESTEASARIFGLLHDLTELHVLVLKLVSPFTSENFT